MPRLFGTDGIRGTANVDLKPTLAYALGRATAHQLAGPGRPIVIGQDTRRSGDMFTAALVAGITSIGVDVHLVGVVPTPALAYITGAGEFAAGIMVSASHNPASDNGLKVLDEHGLKLEQDVEDELEQLIWNVEELPGAAADALGLAIPDRDLLNLYLDHRLKLAAATPTRLHVVVDCANGSGGIAAGQILEATGAKVDVLFNDPDGSNINADCGATCPGALAAEVAARGADVGFALDGDADRLIAVDASGCVVDGDAVLGILALDRLARNCLPNGALVVSVLSNGGLQRVVEEAGGQIIRTPVGDKYILEGMLVNGAGLGGEKSGHVIVLEHTTSGDGIVTALEVLSVMTRTDRSLADLAAGVPMLPQQQRTIPARHRDQWEGDPAIRRAIAGAEARLGPGGRVLVRPSGTEPAIRVMVEGTEVGLVNELADQLAALAGERLN
ncbi:MAG TPA: phosphoglucosamine mutase [Candidatus Limnocylindrales bacterium]